MKALGSKFVLGLSTVVLLFAGCKQAMVISDVDYAQPIETVLIPNEEGTVQDIQHGLTFNILPLQYEETQDSSSVTTEEIRIIRGSEGFYYITAPGYSHVYVMSPEENSLKMEHKIKINEEGISQPAFNQRDPYIQLLNRETNEVYSLTPEGMREEFETETALNQEEAILQ